MLDVLVNKRFAFGVFKDQLKPFYSPCSYEGNVLRLRVKRIAKTNLTLLCQWITACQYVSPEANVKSLKQAHSQKGAGGRNVFTTNTQNIKDKHDQPATKYVTLYWIHVLPLLLNIKIYMEFQYWCLGYLEIHLFTNCEFCLINRQSRL